MPVQALALALALTLLTTLGLLSAALTTTTKQQHASARCPALLARHPPRAPNATVLPRVNRRLANYFAAVLVERPALNRAVLCVGSLIAADVVVTSASCLLHPTNTTTTYYSLNGTLPPEAKVFVHIPALKVNPYSPSHSHRRAMHAVAAATHPLYNYYNHNNNHNISINNQSSPNAAYNIAWVRFNLNPAYPKRNAERNATHTAAGDDQAQQEQQRQWRRRRKRLKIGDLSPPENHSQTDTDTAPPSPALQGVAVRMLSYVSLSSLRNRNDDEGEGYAYNNNSNASSEDTEQHPQRQQQTHRQNRNRQRFLVQTDVPLTSQRTCDAWHSSATATGDDSHHTSRQFMCAGYRDRVCSTTSATCDGELFDDASVPVFLYGVDGAPVLIGLRAGGWGRGEGGGASGACEAGESDSGSLRQRQSRTGVEAPMPIVRVARLVDFLPGSLGMVGADELRTVVVTGAGDEYPGPGSTASVSPNPSANENGNGSASQQTDAANDDDDDDDDDDEEEGGGVGVNVALLIFCSVVGISAALVVRAVVIKVGEARRRQAEQGREVQQVPSSGSGRRRTTSRQGWSGGGSVMWTANGNNGTGLCRVSSGHQYASQNNTPNRDRERDRNCTPDRQRNSTDSGVAQRFHERQGRRSPQGAHQQQLAVEMDGGRLLRGIGLVSRRNM